MKQILCSLTALFLVFVSMPAMAAGPNFWLENQVIINDVPAVIHGGLAGNFWKSSFGYYAYGHVASDGFKEIYAGPKWRIFPWLEIGIGIGRENAFSSVRKNAFFSISKDKISAYGTFEDGGSGPWHTALLNYRFGAVGIGAMDQAFLGLGPRIEYNPCRKVKLWGSYLHDSETKKNFLMFAVNFSF